MGLHRSIESEEQRRSFAVKVQWARAFTFTGGVLVAMLARLLGQLELGLAGLLLFFVVANGSAMVFSVLAIRGQTRLGRVPAHWLWLAIDVGLFVWVVLATGGSASLWFPWALANVATAGFVLGERGALLIMAADGAAYLAAVLLSEGPAGLSPVVIRLLLLYAAGFVALRGVCRLRTRNLRIAYFKEREGLLTARARQLQRNLDERAAQIERLSEELRRTSVTDPETGTFNRRYLRQRIGEDLAMVRRAHGRPRVAGERGRDLGFLLLDLDDFKRINSEGGHRAGDEVLSQVTAVLDRTVRGMDTVIRWNSDTFLLLLRQISPEDLSEVARRVCHGIRHEAFLTPEHQAVSLTCCCGSCTYPFADLERFTWEEIVKIADQALQLAKADGPDRVIEVRTGTRTLDAVGARLAIDDLREAAHRGYVSLIQT